MQPPACSPTAGVVSAECDGMLGGSSPRAVVQAAAARAESVAKPAPSRLETGLDREPRPKFGRVLVMDDSAVGRKVVVNLRLNVAVPSESGTAR